MKHADTIHKLRAIVEPVCADNGYDLVEVEYTSTPAGWVVRVYIDRGEHVSEATPIGFKDCERLSKELSEVLDVEDPLTHAYSLEVSSPGIDRPLRSAAHFQRFAGQTAKIAMAVPKDGRRNFKGVVVAVEPPGPDGTDVIVEVDGKNYSLAISDIQSARLVPDWDQLMKQGSSRR